jgi:hypothetical protein
MSRESQDVGSIEEVAQAKTITFKQHVADSSMQIPLVSV